MRSINQYLKYTVLELSELFLHEFIHDRFQTYWDAAENLQKYGYRFYRGQYKSLITSKI